MATKLEDGQIYKAAAVKTGKSSRGPWMFTSVVDDRGKNEITLFIRNTDCNLRDGQRFKITDIAGITLGVRKGKGQYEGKWFPSYTADVVIEPIASEFDDLPDIKDGDDPWSALVGGDPFEVPEEDQLPL